MYISKLKLYGFKSFLKKSEIIFGKGVTCIVGPNGCGKTNIVDALRWVIGEQKSRILRADRNTDVIFNGTATRKQLNLAEVSLTIHNVSGNIPTEYSDIEIIRRVYRNSDSEYFINKNLCRLKDITNLFIDTGMGANAYSIIELKMIDDILSENPHERKKLFEEAAGVNKYRIQRRTALRKLEATVDDMTRVADIIGEVDLKVKNLKKQLRKYESYTKVTTQLIDTSVLLATCKVNKINSESKPISRDLEINEQKHIQVSNNLKIKENEAENKQKLFDTAESEVNKKNKLLIEIQNERNQFQTNDLLLNEQLLNLEQEIKRLQDDIKIINESVVNAEKKKVYLIKEEKNCTDNLKKISEEFLNFSSSDQGMEEKYKLIDLELNNLQEEKYNLIKEQAGSDARYNALLENIGRITKEIEDIEKQVIEINNNINLSETNLNQIKLKKTTYNEELEECQELLIEEALNFDEIKSEQLKLQNEQRQINMNIDKVQNKIEFYTGIIKAKEGFSPALHYILDNPNEFPGVLGSLSDLISVDSKYYIAVESVLNDISTMIVSKTKKVALDTIKKITNLGKGKISIIPLDLNLNSTPKISINNPNLEPLVNFIKCDPNLDDIVKILFANIYCCSDDKFDELTIQKTFENIIIVSDNGRLKDLTGIFIGGSEITETNILIGRTDTLFEFETKFDDLQRTKVGIDQQYRKIEEELTLSIQNQNQFKGKIKNIEKNIFFVEKEISKNQQKTIQLRNMIKSLDGKKHHEKVAYENFSEKLKKENPDKEKRQKRLLDLEKIIEKKRNEEIIIKENINKLTEQRQNFRVELLNEENKNKNINNELQSIYFSLKQQQVRSVSKNEQIEKDIIKKTELIKNIEINKLSLEKITKETQALSKNVDESRLKYQKLRKEIQDLNQILYIQRTEKDILFKKIKELELKQSNFLSEAKEIRSVLLEKYGKEIPEEIPENLPEINDTIIRIEKLKKKLESIGMVNLAVKDEYEEEAERLKFLTDQRDDLIESEETLRSVISQIDDIARKKYMEVFEKICENFKSTFNIFFKGGTADIRLVGDGDPLDANIEIFACPGGKKMLSLRMLSAGEKTLTAIALLFGIYQVKPSPFCILDEVDAPLDDSNTRRFTKLLKTFADKTQFIIVTHNKVTMSEADSLYGITMGEKGVSQIVSVKLD